MGFPLFKELSHFQSFFLPLNDVFTLIKICPQDQVSNFIVNNAYNGRTLKIVSEYDQEIPQSQTADNPVAPRGRAAQPSRDTRKTN